MNLDKNGKEIRIGDTLSIAEGVIMGSHGRKVSAFEGRLTHASGAVMIIEGDRTIFVEPGDNGRLNNIEIITK